MKKRFTMLLASLFLTLGTAWAYQFSYDKATWTVPATNHEKVTTVPEDVFTVYNANYSDAAALDANKVGVYAQDVNVTDGTVTVTLAYTGGNIRLDICGVDLVAADGSVMYKDYHFGYAGGNSSNNTYTLNEVVKGSYTLRVFVPSQKEDFTNASNNSRGNMTVTGAELPGMNGVVTSIENLSNDKLYAIVPKDATRGAMYATSTSENLDACGGSRGGAANSGVEIDATSADQQFAIYKHNEELFLYSVGAGKFVNDLSGNLFPLVETPRHNIALEASDLGYFIIKVKETEFINVSTGHDAGCVGKWNYVDDGNKLQITEVADMTDEIRAKLATAFAAAEAALVPEVSTEESPKYYTIGSYDRGGFLTNMGEGEGVKHVAATVNSLWYFTEANENGGVYICSKTGGYLADDRTVSDTPAVWYVLSNGVNLDGVSISSTDPISGYSCVDANRDDKGVGAWSPSKNDWRGTTWNFVKVVPEHLSIVSAKVGEVAIEEGAATVESIATIDVTFDRPVTLDKSAGWPTILDEWGGATLQAEVLPEYNEAAEGATHIWDETVGEYREAGEGETATHIKEVGCVVRFTADEYTTPFEYVVNIPEGLVVGAEALYFINSEIEATITIEGGSVEPATPLALVNVTVGTNVMAASAIVAQSGAFIYVNFDGTFYFDGTPAMVDANGDDATEFFQYVNGWDYDGSNAYILSGMQVGTYTITLPKASFATYMPTLMVPAEDVVLKVQIVDAETAIESVETETETVIYDLSGRRVEKMEKGIYIVNGKKVIK